VQIGIEVEKIPSAAVEKAYEALYDVKTPTDGYLPMVSGDIV